jgi:hypothetical protein
MKIPNAGQKSIKRRKEAQKRRLKDPGLISDVREVQRQSLGLLLGGYRENGVTKYKDMYGGTKLHAKNIVYMKVCCCPSLSQQLPT